MNAIGSRSGFGGQKPAGFGAEASDQHQPGATSGDKTAAIKDKKSAGGKVMEVAVPISSSLLNQCNGSTCSLQHQPDVALNCSAEAVSGFPYAAGIAQQPGIASDIPNYLLNQAMPSHLHCFALLFLRLPAVYNTASHLSAWPSEPPLKINTSIVMTGWTAMQAIRDWPYVLEDQSSFCCSWPDS